MKNSSFCPTADAHTQFMPANTPPQKSHPAPGPQLFTPDSFLVLVEALVLSCLEAYQNSDSLKANAHPADRQCLCRFVHHVTGTCTQELQRAGLQLSAGVTNCKALTQGTRTPVQLMWASKLKASAQISEQAFGKHHISMLIAVSPKSTYMYNRLKKPGHA